LASAAMAAAPEDQEPLAVRWEGGRLAADVGAVPVLAVLDAVGRATGADVKATGQLGSTSPQSFEAAPLEGALRRLLGNHGFMVVYSPPGPGEAGRQVARIRVYATEPSMREADTVSRPQAAAVAARADLMAGRTVSELADLGDEGAAELQQMFRSEGDGERRRQLVAAMVALGASNAAGALTLALRDADPDIRSEAARGLADIEGGAAADVLRAALSNEEDDGVRLELKRIVERIPARAARQG
jgi:hypothetical protein